MKNQSYLAILAGLLSINVFAQSAVRPVSALDNAIPNFGISLKYNTDYDRYEVYAQANFTKSRFILGPSQISIVVPKQVPDQPLAIYSETASWTDYSSVYAPAAAPGVDFHGINSMGKSIDFQDGQPFMLFSFNLKGGFVDGVRLYVNGQDPASSHKAMMGGDFANTIQDYQGKDFYRSAFNQADLIQLTEKTTEPGAPDVSVYPNPVVGDNFTVTTKQFNAGERLKLRIISASGVVISTVEEDVDKLINYRIRVPKQLSGQAYLYAERSDSAEGQRTFCKKLIISN